MSFYRKERIYFVVIDEFTLGRVCLSSRVGFEFFYALHNFNDLIFCDIMNIKWKKLKFTKLKLIRNRLMLEISAKLRHFIFKAFLFFLISKENLNKTKINIKIKLTTPWHSVVIRSMPSNFFSSQNKMASVSKWDAIRLLRYSFLMAIRLIHALYVG